jgi:hypothetical protein
LQIGLTGFSGVRESRANLRVCFGSSGGGKLAPAGRVGCGCRCVISLHDKEDDLVGSL